MDKSRKGHDYYCKEREGKVMRGEAGSTEQGREGSVFLLFKFLYVCFLYVRFLYVRFL